MERIATVLVLVMLRGVLSVLPDRVFAAEQERLAALWFDLHNQAIPEGAQTDSGFGKVRNFDDFCRKALDTTNLWNIRQAGGTDPAINLQANGVVRITGDGTDGDIDQLNDMVIYRPTAGGPLMCEWRVIPRTSVADGEYFVGLTDEDAAETPIQVSTADVQTDSATDAVGFCYTGAGTANWKACAVKNNSSRTPVACNQGGVTTPVVGTYQIFKIVINVDGDADFYINGKLHARIDDAVTAATLLAPSIGQQTGGTARGIDADYRYVECGRV